MKLLGLWVAVALVAGVAHVARADAPPPVADAPPKLEFLGFDATVGLSTSSAHDDAYADRLRDFGFQYESTTIGRYALALDVHLREHLAIGATFFNLDAEDYSRDNQGVTQAFTWDSHAVGGFVQGDLATEPQRTVVFFARFGAGLAYGTSHLDEIVVEGDFSGDGLPPDSYDVHTRDAKESFSSYYLAGSLGVQIMPFEHGGLLMEARYVHAPALENLTGETHDLGGLAVMFGLRLRIFR
jgi:hypothetical protein